MRVLLLIAVLFSFFKGFTQPFKYFPSSYPRFLNASGDSLKTPYSGGLVNPMFSNIDLNGDSLQDLFVFDKADGKVMTFLANAKNSTTYTYAPQYEYIFPKMNGWAYLIDYNGDGKKDIFTFAGNLYVSNTGLTVYKNIGKGKENKFTNITYAMNTRILGGSTEIFCSGIELPAFEDFDGDGDIDMVSFKPGEGTFVWYYKNKAMENFSSPDSFDYALKDQCWGKVLENSAATHSMMMGVKCGEYLALQNEKHSHSGSTICALDMDNDGDMELLISDVTFNTVFKLEDGRKRTGMTDWPRDTVVSIDTLFPSSHPINLSEMPICSHVDVNNDGSRDLIASSSTEGTTQKESVWYYNNTGPDKKPVFKFTNGSFLEETQADFGEYAAPAFLDYDNDGLTDLLIGSFTEISSGVNGYTLQLYRNIGTGSRPVFKLITNDFLSLKGIQNNIVPSAADLGSSGKKDIIIGNSSGKLIWFKNAGSGNFTSSGNIQTVDPGGFADLDAGNNSKPTFGDINGDGKPDLIVGSSDTHLAYYRGKGILSGKAAFELVTTSFGNISLGKNMAPALADLDQDGKLDLVVGTDTGGLVFFRDIDSTGAFTSAKTSVYNFGSGSFENPFLGKYTIPAVGQLDNDNVPDMMVGTIRGGLISLCSQNHGIDSIPHGSTSIKIVGDPKNWDIQVYPNPTSGQITFSGHLVQPAMHLEVYDQRGRTVFKKEIKTESATVQVDLNGLSPGSYILTLTGKRLEFNTLLIIERK